MALSVASELEDLEGSDHFAKIGDFYLRLENYSQAISAYEKYAKEKPGM